MEDRRIFKRFRVDIPVKFLVVENNKDGLGTIVDISAGGLGLIMTVEKIQPLSHLEMWLEISENKDPIRACGQVAWLKQVKSCMYRIGIQFDKVDFMGISKILRIKGALRDAST